MTTKQKTKIMMAKFGLDGHNNGMKIVTQWLRDAGFQVIFMGLYNTPEKIIKAAVEEDVDIIGASFATGAHVFYVPRLIEQIKKNKLDNVKLVVGGNISPDDIPWLKELGVKQVYTPGTTRDVIINSIEALS